MEVQYIITSHYYNGDEYADKLDSLAELIEVLQDIEKQDTDATEDDNRIDSKQIAITTEEV